MRRIRCWNAAQVAKWVDSTIRCDDLSDDCQRLPGPEVSFPNLVMAFPVWTRSGPAMQTNTLWKLLCRLDEFFPQILFTTTAVVCWSILVCLLLGILPDPRGQLWAWAIGGGLFSSLAAVGAWRLFAISKGGGLVSPDYAFAHHALRHSAMSDPARFLALVASPEAISFIDALLKNVAVQCGQPTTFGATSVKIHPRRVNGFPCAVIELPEPKGAAEAFMVALVVQAETDANGLPAFESAKGRFFSLEKGLSVIDETRTVLGEWDMEGGHTNYGDGPSATVEGFVAALSRLL